MKKLYKIFAMLILVTLSAASCISEKPNYLYPTPDASSKETGYLELGGMSVNVIYDSDTETQPSQATQSQATRLSPASDSFLITITNAQGEAVLEVTYGELKAMFNNNDGRIELPVGSYTMEICSEQASQMPIAAWERPLYGTTYEFGVLKNQTTEIETVICKLQNIKVSVMIAADLKALLSSGQSSVALLDAEGAAKGSLDFSLEEIRNGFFMPIEAVNTLFFSFSGIFSDDGSPADISKTITGVKGGQWRKISLVVPNVDEGDVKIEVIVDNFIQDEEIDVNATEGLWEPEIPDMDPSAPTLIWTDHDLTAPFQLKASMFDAQGACTEPFAFAITSPNGVKSMTMQISSNDATFQGWLAEKQIPAEAFDLCAVTVGSTLYTSLKEMGFPVNTQVAGVIAPKMDLAPMMKPLYDNSSATASHSIAWTLTDENGLSVSATLQLTIDKENEVVVVNGPQVVWRDHDLNVRYDVTEDMEIEIDITAEKGIKNFVVTINSPMLEPLLPAIGLPVGVNTFDLTNIDPNDAALYDALTNFLMFPVNEQVIGETSLAFSITPFVPMLAVPDFAGGLHDFHLDITDNDGNTTSVVVKMKTPEL